MNEAVFDTAALSRKFDVSDETIKLKGFNILMYFKQVHTVCENHPDFIMDSVAAFLPVRFLKKSQRQYACTIVQWLDR